RVQINQDTAQFSQDTAQFSALCRSVGPFNGFCQRPFTASAVDSGGTPIPSAAGFQWRLTPAGDTIASIDAVSGADHGTVLVSAHADGALQLIAHDSALTGLGDDTLAITVHQQAANLLVAPDSITA